MFAAMRAQEELAVMAMMKEQKRAKRKARQHKVLKRIRELKRVCICYMFCKGEAFRAQNWPKLKFSGTKILCYFRTTWCMRRANGAWRFDSKNLKSLTNTKCSYFQRHKGVTYFSTILRNKLYTINVSMPKMLFLSVAFRWESHRESRRETLGCDKQDMMYQLQSRNKMES